MLKEGRSWPSREELYDLYWNRGLSLHRISKQLGVDRRTLRRLMERRSIKLRTHQEVLALLSRTSWITDDLLYELYWKQRLSQTKIAAQLGLSRGYVGRLMERQGVLRRPLSEAGQKYQKVSFSGNTVDRAYMLGLRTGDLNASRSGFQIRLSTSTTHPALWTLLNEIFGKYGRVGRSAALSRGYYEWATYCYLDSSFEFLLDKCRVIPEEILANEQLFLAFLAGYVDAERSFRVYEVEGAVAVSLRINSEDEEILRGIARKLKGMGYHVYFALPAKAGRHRERSIAVTSGRLVCSGSRK